MNKEFNLLLHVEAILSRCELIVLLKQPIKEQMALLFWQETESAPLLLYHVSLPTGTYLFYFVNRLKGADFCTFKYYLKSHRKSQKDLAEAVQAAPVPEAAVCYKFLYPRPKQRQR